MNKHEENTLLYRHGLAQGAQDDVRRCVYLEPKAILWTSEQGVTNSNALLEPHPVQVALHNTDCCVLHTVGAPASVLLDYGQELSGGLTLGIGALNDAEEVTLRVRFGESASEAMSDVGGAGGATNDHACRDWTVTSRFLSMMNIAETGFRFVRIDLLTEGASAQICFAKARFVFRDLPYLGSFSCDDALLNRIWEVGAYTVHLNMQTYIWDGIKRDRLVWIGDLHPEVSTVQAVFGNRPLIRKSLDLAAAQTPADEWMNDFPSYSMWWIIIQNDHYHYSGDRAYLAQQLPYLKTLFRNLSAQIAPNGQDVSPNRFLDWPTRGHDDAVDAGIQALHILAAQASAEIFAEFGENELAKQAEDDCAKLRKFAVKCDGYKQSAAMAVLAGLLDAEQTNETMLKKGGAAGMSTFMGYYILLAMAKAGDYAGALKMIREYWGGMLKLGATSFWEDFDIDWLQNAAPIDRLPREGEVDVHASYGRFCYTGYRHSLCHGWASGPTAWLSRHVLGVEFLEAGGKKIRIRPHLGDLKWVEGTYPTPYGEIYLRHEACADGSVKTTVQAPDAIEILDA